MNLMLQGKIKYEIPPSCIFSCERPIEKAPNIRYYFSPPPSTTKKFPIAVLCTGSSQKDKLHSVIHFHRFYLQEFLDLGIGVLTIEQWGIDGDEKIDKEEFWNHYTRSQRLDDHKQVLWHLSENKPAGWNGKLIFLGVSEGGPIVLALTNHFKNSTLATMNFCGAGLYSWQKELFDFMQDLLPTAPWHLRTGIRGLELINMLPEKIIPSSSFLLSDEKKFCSFMENDILNNPTTDKDFLGMSYKYHADAIKFEEPNFEVFQNVPLLVVAGSKENLNSCDAFVKMAENYKAKITYKKIEGMDHYIRRRPDAIQECFEWLKNQLDEQQP